MTAFMKVEGLRPTGQTGVIYFQPETVIAIIALSSVACRVLLQGSPEWLQVNMTAPAFIALIGATVTP